MNEPFHTLISAAVLAPSGDNMQPWRFEIDEAESMMTVCVDETRDTSPMNAGQRMARIACGAALENIVRTADYNGWASQILRYLPSGRGVTLRIAAENLKAGEIEDCILQRTTQRVRYNGQPIPVEIIQRLQRCATDDPRAKMLWITDPHLIGRLADQIAQSDAIMFGDPRFLRAFLGNIRWDSPADEVADHGLELGTLGLSGLEEKALPVMPKLPDWILRRGFCKGAFGRKAKANVGSSSGIWILLTDQASAENDFVVGRLMQRAWLRLTEAGLAAQPMMSLPVLLGSLEFENTLSLETVQSVEMIHDRFREPIGVAGPFVIAAMMRFGYAERAATRTGRRSIEGLTTFVPSTPARRSAAY